MSTLTQLHTAIVKISYVEERPSKGGLRRFLVGAERTDTAGDTLAEVRLGFSTLDPWKASLCQQARDKGFPLRVKYRLTKYFDADLLFVEMVKEEPQPDGDPERDRSAAADLEYWQRGDHSRDH